jgi:hypothetical protein
MSTLTNEQIESLINKRYPFLKTDFGEYEDTVRILPNGDEVMKDGLPPFDYWIIDNKEKNYTMKVHNELHKFLEHNNLYAECQNPESWHIYNI